MQRPSPGARLDTATRFGIGIAVVALAAALVSGAAWRKQSLDESAISERARALSVDAGQSVRAVDSWFRERWGDATTIAADAVALSRSRGVLARADRLRLASELTAITSGGGYAGAWVAGPDGDPLAASTGAASPSADERAAARAVARTGRGVVLVPADAERGTLALSLVAPVGWSAPAAPTHDVPAAVVLRIDPTHSLFPLVRWSGVRAAERTQLLIPDGAGYLVVGPPADGEAAPVARRVSASELPLATPGAETPAAVDRTLRALRGGPAIGAVRRVPGAGWLVVQSASEAAVLALAAREARTEALLVVELFAALALGALIFVRRVRTSRWRDAATNEAKLAEAQAIAHLGSWEWYPGTDVVAWSDEMFRLAGLPPQSVAMTYERVLETAHPDDRDMIRGEVARAVEAATEFAYDYRVVWPDGRIRTLHAHGNVIRQNGTAVHLVGTAQDVTELRAATDALRQSEARYRGVIDSVREVIFETDRDGRWTFLSPGWAAITEFPETESLGRPCTDFVDAVDQPAVSEAMTSLLVRGRPVAPLTVRCRTRSGGFRWMNVRARVRLDGTGAVVGTSGTLNDVTEQVIAQAAHAASEAELQSVFGAMRDVVLVLSRDGRYLKIPATDADPLYRPSPILLGRLVHEVMPSAVADSICTAIARALDERTTVVVEYGLDVGGSPMWFRGTISPFGRNRDAVVCVARDITAERHAEHALRTSEERFRSLIEHTSDSITIVDAWGTIRYGSPAHASIFGYAPTAIVGRNAFAQVHPEDRPAAERAFRRLLEQRDETQMVELRCRRRQGGWATVVVLGRNMLDDPAVAGLVLNSRDITARRAAEAALRDSEISHRMLLESLPVIVYRARPTPPYGPIYVSPAVEMFGYPRAEWLDRPDMWMRLIHPDDRGRVQAETEAALAAGTPVEYEYRLVAKNGAVHWVHDRGDFVRDADGRTTAWQGIMLDVTERKRLEAQLRQAQKMEAVGQLAGGIAHDFNNLLTVITTCSSFLFDALAFNDPRRSDVEQIRAAGGRAAALTRQLLAFSRQQVLRPQPLDLRTVTAGVEKMLVRLIGEDIRVVTEHAAGLDRVLADPGQLEQVILNLAVNARDAMPHGGVLRIETSNVVFSGEYGEPEGTPHPIQPGRYVMLAVSDTGCGMDAATRARIFEPFFTTKAPGEGTGLGLATVYGIVRQSEGFIHVYSELGEGTTFRIYLPCVAQNGSVPADAAALPPPPRGVETILVVEDEPAVRALARRILQRHGYAVLEAANGFDALTRGEQHSGPIHLVLTDVIMPAMNGAALAERLTQLRPDTRVLYMSGYTDGHIVERGQLGPGTDLLQKPFSPHDLLSRVRQALDRPLPAGADRGEPSGSAR